MSRADDAIDAVKGTSKLLDDAVEVYTQAIQNFDGTFAVLGKLRDNIQQSYQKMAENIGATHHYTDKFVDFVKKYGYEAWWKHVNKPFIQKEIIEKGKTVLLSTPERVIKGLDPAKT